MTRIIMQETTSCPQGGTHMTNMTNTNMKPAKPITTTNTTPKPQSSSIILPTLHSFLGRPYLARNLSEVTFLNILIYLVETILTYVLFLIRLLWVTITDKYLGTGTAALVATLELLTLMTPTIPCQAALLTSVILLAYRLMHSFFDEWTKFYAIGRGGTPSTFFGYVRITVLELFRVNKFVPMDPVPFPGFISSDFPFREGPRPNVVGIAPSRQCDCLPPEGPTAVYDSLVSTLQAFADMYPSQLDIHNSFLEGAIPAMFALQPTDAAFAEFGNEIGHAHTKDGSMHLVMHPNDTAIVISRGWGERHPLCQNHHKSWVFWHHIHNDRPCVPESLVLIYAPRTQFEMQVVVSCIRAAAAYCAGVKTFHQTIRIPPTLPQTAVELDTNIGSNPLSNPISHDNNNNCCSGEPNTNISGLKIMSSDYHVLPPGLGGARVDTAFYKKFCIHNDDYGCTDQPSDTTNIMAANLPNHTYYYGPAFGPPTYSDYCSDFYADDYSEEYCNEDSSEEYSYDDDYYEEHCYDHYNEDDDHPFSSSDQLNPTSIASPPTTTEPAMKPPFGPGFSILEDFCVYPPTAARPNAQLLMDLVEKMEKSKASS